MLKITKLYYNASNMFCQVQMKCQEMGSMGSKWYLNRNINLQFSMVLYSAP